MTERSPWFPENARPARRSALLLAGVLALGAVAVLAIAASHTEQPRQVVAAGRIGDLEAAQENLKACLWTHSERGDLSSYDGGRSARALLDKCSQPRDVVLRHCQAAVDRAWCEAQPLVAAQLAIKLRGI